MEFWESKFREEGAMWKFEPSESAAIALKLFKDNGIQSILIPGFGYGRNAKLFVDSGINVTGIEIAQSAIDLAKANGLSNKIHHGSVTSMPFDDATYQGIFCYALLHLLSKPERKVFLQACYNQLVSGGFMVFAVVSALSNLYGKGTILSKDRFRMMNGLNVYFYHTETIKKELQGFKMIEIREIDEPIKFMTGQEPLKCILVIARKP